MTFLPQTTSSRTSALGASTEDINNAPARRVAGTFTIGPPVSHNYTVCDLCYIKRGEKIGVMCGRPRACKKNPIDRAARLLAVMCPACCCGHVAAGLDGLRRPAPNQSSGLDCPLTHAGVCRSFARPVRHHDLVSRKLPFAAAPLGRMNRLTPPGLLLHAGSSGRGSASPRRSAPFCWRARPRRRCAAGVRARRSATGSTSPSSPSAARIARR